VKFKLGELGLVAEILAAIVFDRGREEGAHPRHLPTKAAYWLSRFLTRLQEEHQAFEERRIALCQAHAKKDKDGQFAMIRNKACVKCGAVYAEDAKEEVCACGGILRPASKYDIADQEAFGKELAELREIEIELPWRKIPLEMLGDTAFTGEEMALLSFFIEEPDDMKAETPEKKEAE
jgi:hypothetical protein